MRTTFYKKKLDDLILACKRNLRRVDEDLIRRAFEFSLSAHKQDLRASGEPFFNHPYEVSLIVVKEIPLDDISVAAALLHDVAEDTDYEIKDIRQEFGSTIADIVDGATKITDIFKSHEITQAESFRKMLLSMVDDIRVILIKFADRLHNMRTLEFLPLEKRGRIAQDTLEIYAPFAHRFGLAKVKWEFEDLAFKNMNPVEYETISRNLKAKRREREHYINRFIKPIEHRLKEEGFEFEIYGRPKHIHSIYSKMQKQSKTMDELHDLFAVRIILETENKQDCYTAVGLLGDIYQLVPGSLKNYISTPKSNGYKSIHVQVSGLEGKRVEVQIRTRQMHEIAERGIAAHWKYKEGKDSGESEIDNWINSVREIFEQATEDTPVKQIIESFKLNLYQDEIFVFTPKGDLKVLPKGATPIDFAFEVHSKVGFHCIGAKVNGKIVPLDSKLISGDQVEIITSKNQTPSIDWEKILVTHKAKSHIRKWFKEEQRKQCSDGHEKWIKRAKKHRININDDELLSYIQKIVSVKNLQEFYIKINTSELNPEVMAREVKHLIDNPIKVEENIVGVKDTFEKFIDTVRNISSGIKLFGTQENYLHNFAKCCNPIPGDPIAGYVTVGEGIKIHRKNCVNFKNVSNSDPNRIVAVDWPDTGEAEFISAIKISGEDRTGLLTDITHTISTYQSTNIRGIDLHAHDSLFEGTIIINVKNTEHLIRMMEKLKKIKGVRQAVRLEN